MKETSNTSEENNDESKCQFVRDSLCMMIFQRLVEVDICSLVCKSSTRSENFRDIFELDKILIKCKEAWKMLLSLVISKKVSKTNGCLIKFEKILNEINISDKFPDFVKEYIKKEKDRYSYFINNGLSDLLAKDISVEKLSSEIGYKIYSFRENSGNDIEKYVDSFSRNEKDDIIKSAFQNKNQFDSTNNLVKSIMRSYYDGNLKEDENSEMIDVFDSRIEKLNKMSQSQQIIFKNKIIDLEESIKNQRDELKRQTEDTIQTLRENLEGQVGRIGMEKALSVASSRIRKSRRLAFAGFIVGLVLLFFVGCSLLFSNSDDINNQMIWSTQNIIHTVGRYIVVATIVWWTWFIAKRVSQLVKIEEDYAFKETIVLFYKGHCEEVADDEFLSRELLQLTIKMFAENPTRLLEKRECALPVQELVTIITDSLKAGKK